MDNLAGDRDCDRKIARELRRAGIEAVPCELETIGEVPATIAGRLGPFTFRRAWYYWVAKGDVPLAVARELYADEVGKEDIRASGDCACRPPETWAEWRTPEGSRLLPTAEKAEVERFLARFDDPGPFKDVAFADDPSAGGLGFVTSYHIDTEVGLRLFVDAVKRHGLVQAKGEEG